MTERLSFVQRFVPTSWLYLPFEGVFGSSVGLLVRLGRLVFGPSRRSSWWRSSLLADVLLLATGLSCRCGGCLPFESAFSPVTRGCPVRRSPFRCPRSAPRCWPQRLRLACFRKYSYRSGVQSRRSCTRSLLSSLFPTGAVSQPSRNGKNSYSSYQLLSLTQGLQLHQPFHYGDNRSSIQGSRSGRWKIARHRQAANT